MEKLSAKKLIKRSPGEGTIGSGGVGAATLVVGQYLWETWNFLIFLKYDFACM